MLLMEAIWHSNSILEPGLLPGSGCGGLVQQWSKKTDSLRIAEIWGDMGV